MPNDFTASVIPVLQTEFPSVFKNKGTVNPELTNTPVTIAAVLAHLTANAMPIEEGSGKLCVGAEVWYPTADNVAEPTVFTTPQASDCVLTTGDGLSTAKSTFALNVFQKFTIAINDKDCDNQMKFVQKTAFLMANKMHLMARALNTKMINDLEANKSVASATNLPTGVTVNAGLNYEIAGAAFWTGIGAADIIPILDQLAYEKGLPGNYYIISGKALAIPSIMARDHAANDNERSYTITFSSRELINDIKNLDPIITAEVIYLVDPNCVVSYFHNEYKTAEDVGDANNTVTFSMPLVYFTNFQDGASNQATLSYMNNGMSTPVMVDMRYQKVCNSATNNNGYVTHDHITEMILTGMISFVPKVGDNSGIIRVDKA